MSDKKKQQSKLLVKVRGLLLGLCLIAGVGVGLAYAAGDNRKLQNPISGRYSFRRYCHLCI